MEAMWDIYFPAATFLSVRRDFLFPGFIFNLIYILFGFITHCPSPEEEEQSQYRQNHMVVAFWYGAIPTEIFPTETPK